MSMADGVRHCGERNPPADKPNDRARTGVCQQRFGTRACVGRKPGEPAEGGIETSHCQPEFTHDIAFVITGLYPSAAGVVTSSHSEGRSAGNGSAGNCSAGKCSVNSAPAA